MCGKIAYGGNEGAEDLFAHMAHLSKGSLSFTSSYASSSPVTAASGFSSSFVTSTPTSNTTLQCEEDRRKKGAHHSISHLVIIVNR